MSYWYESLKKGDGMLGTAVVLDKKEINLLGETDDQYYGSVKHDTRFSFDYYGGFSWTEFGVANTKDEWNDYIKMTALKIANPMKMSFLKQ